MLYSGFCYYVVLRCRIQSSSELNSFSLKIDGNNSCLGKPSSVVFSAMAAVNLLPSFVFVAVDNVAVFWIVLSSDCLKDVALLVPLR